MGRFLIDFGCIFGKCFVDLWSIFDIFLIFVVNVLWACYLSKARWRGWPKATGSGAPEGVLLCGIQLLNFLNRPYLSVLTIKTHAPGRAGPALTLGFFCYVGLKMAPSWTFWPLLSNFMPSPVTSNFSFQKISLFYRFLVDF